METINISVIAIIISAVVGLLGGGFGSKLFILLSKATLMSELDRYATNKDFGELQQQVKELEMYIDTVEQTTQKVATAIELQTQSLERLYDDNNKLNARVTEILDRMSHQLNELSRLQTATDSKVAVLLDQKRML
jgi:chromosome segregation ATPase